jgi:hypothetical protein
MDRQLFFTGTAALFMLKLARVLQTKRHRIKQNVPFHFRK